MYDIYHTPAFLRDFKRCLKKHRDISLLEEAIEAISCSDEVRIPARYNAHALKGNLHGQREIHLGERNSNRLLVYKIEGDTLYLSFALIVKHPVLENMLRCVR